MLKPCRSVLNARQRQHRFTNTECEDKPACIYKQLFWNSGWAVASLFEGTQHAWHDHACATCGEQASASKTIFGG